jgi:hypothetical protein
MYVACKAYIYDEIIGPETSPRACILFKGPINLMKKVVPETSPKACTWPVQPIYVMKNVGPETSPTI